MNVEAEIKHLIAAIQRLGTENSKQQHEVTFGVLFNDDECANLFEAIVGTLKAAKRKKIVAYDAELLLQGVHDNVKITLLKSEV